MKHMEPMMHGKHFSLLLQCPEASEAMVNFLRKDRTTKELAKYGGDFSQQVIGRSILTTSKKWSGVVHVNKNSIEKRDPEDLHENP